MGLSAVVELSRVRTTQHTAHLFSGGEGRKGIKSVWRHALEQYRNSVASHSPDARHLQRVENNIRKNFYSILFNTAVRYGNTEQKRKRRQEDKKYLNSSKDYAGARLRNVGASRYPFPPTREITLENGEVVRGYPGNTHSPLYVPRHTAPELDFMDMIRGHTDELIRQCLKYAVPLRDARHFIDRLVEILMPFLNYVYTQGKTGRPHFVKDATKELRSLVTEIARLYGTRNGVRPSITASLQSSESTNPSYEEPTDNSQLSETEMTGAEHEVQEEAMGSESDEQKCSISSLFNDVIDRCDVEHNPEWAQSVRILRSLLANKILIDRDAEYLLDRLVEESRQLGVAFHDFAASSGFAMRPFNLFQVIRHGDESLTRKSGLLCASEVPVVKEGGRIDQCLFRRKELARSDGSRGPILYEPAMLVEIKTRSAFDLDTYATRTKSKKHPERRVIEFNIERRRIAEEEWMGVLSNAPSQYEIAQLDAYEKALLSEYKSIARFDPDPHSCLDKAVLVVDTSENWALVRQCLAKLLFTAYSSLEQGLERTVFHCELEGRRLHAALVTLPSTKQDREVSAPESVHAFDPFQYSTFRKDDREFTLYLTVAARGPSSESAAVISGRWHGLRLVHSISRRRNIVWFDMSGEYSDAELREQRLWLRQQTKAIQSMVRNRVTFIDLSRELSNYGNGTKRLRSVIGQVSAAFSSNARPVIVVSGGDVARKTMAAGFSEFLTQFLDALPSGCSVLWFDRPVPLTRTSERYGTRCVAPFYPDSPWAHYVDRIVWNMPSPPPKYGSHAPADDDVRVIAYETRSGIHTELATVNVLYGWGERFRSDEPPQNTAREMYLKGSGASQGTVGRPRRTYSEHEIDAALDLVPHLSEQEPIVLENDGLAVVTEDVPLSTELPSGIVSRLRFAPGQSSISSGIDGRVKLLEPLLQVNHRRQYRSTLLHVDPPKWSTRPPAESILGVTDTTIDKISNRELRALKRSLSLLKKRLSTKGDADELVKSLEMMAVSHSEKSPTKAVSVLRAIAKVIENHASSKNLWSVLKHDRAQSPSALGNAQTEYLEKLSAQYPDLFLFTGNDLFLLILSALNEIGIEDLDTHLSRQLWNYVLPWQLSRLGLEPQYHEQHRTGKSVLHRSMLLDTLKRRARALSGALESQVRPTDVRFGQATLMENATLAGQEHLLRILFQYHPSSTDMCIMVTVPPMKGGLDLREGLMTLPRDRPYWGETDVTKLGAAVGRASRSTTLSIMIGMQRGCQGLWVLNEDQTEWLPVGRVEYYARRRENATLVRTMTVLEDASLTAVETEDAPSLPLNLDSLAEVAEGITAVAFRGCETAKCTVSMDYKTRAFSVSIEPIATHAHHDNKPLTLTVDGTAQVLELLRRPEIDCEPVSVGGRQFVWNRFRDITYQGDAALLRPWVERREPFKTTDLNLPKTASDLIDAKKRPGLRIRILHSPDVCPLHPTSRTEIESVRERHGASTSEGLSLIEGSLGQPDSLLNESLYRHGLCWRVSLKSEERLPPGVARLQDIQLSGRALASLLKTGALSYQEGTEWVVHEFEAPGVNSLPREFRESIQLVEAYRSIVPSAMIELNMPGTSMLEIEEMWTVGVRAEPGWVEWSAVSDLTAKHHGGITNEIQLNRNTPLDIAQRRVLNEITRRIPESKIRDFEELGPLIRLRLKDAGYLGGSRQREVIKEDRTTRPRIDSLRITMEYTKMRTEATELVAHGRYDEALEVMDRNIRQLEPLIGDTALRALLVDALISKYELLTSGKMAGTPDPSLLLSISGKVKELVSGINARVLMSRSELGKRVRWVLRMHESVRRKSLT